MDGAAIANFPQPLPLFIRKVTFKGAGWVAHLPSTGTGEWSRPGRRENRWMQRERMSMSCRTSAVIRGKQMPGLNIDQTSFITERGMNAVGGIP